MVSSGDEHTDICDTSCTALSKQIVPVAIKTGHGVYEIHVWEDLCLKCCISVQHIDYIYDHKWALLYLEKEYFVIDIVQILCVTFWLNQWFPSVAFYKENLQDEETRRSLNEVIPNNLYFDLNSLIVGYFVVKYCKKCSNNLTSKNCIWVTI